MNKTIDYYMSLPYSFSITPDLEESGYVVSYPDLPGCITCGNTLEEAVGNAEDAKRCWLEAALEEGIKIAEPEAHNYTGQLRLRIPVDLHKKLALTAKDQNVSMNLYCVLALQKALLSNAE